MQDTKVPSDKDFGQDGLSKLTSCGFPLQKVVLQPPRTTTITTNNASMKKRYMHASVLLLFPFQPFLLVFFLQHIQIPAQQIRITISMSVNPAAGTVTPRQATNPKFVNSSLPRHSSS